MFLQRNRALIFFREERTTYYEKVLSKSYIFAELSLRVVPTETNNKSNGCVVLLAGTVTPQEPSTRN